MSAAEAMRWVSVAFIAAAGLTFVALLRIDAPYGRHRRRGWGPEVPAWLGWLLMEAPAPLLVAGLTVAGGRLDDPAVAVLAGLFVLHYFHRAVLYPLRRRRHASPIPLSVVAMAFAFNLANGSLQGAWIGRVGTRYEAGWLADPRFIAGVGIFLAGLAANVASDEVLLRLRRRSGGAYGVPRGGLFRWVSCPNYLGEIVEWAGWAIAAWSLPALAFAIWTAANLVPRALAHHRWYRARFADYPPHRRALVPGVL